MKHIKHFYDEVANYALPLTHDVSSNIAAIIGGSSNIAAIIGAACINKKHAFIDVIDEQHATVFVLNNDTSSDPDILNQANINVMLFSSGNKIKEAYIVQIASEGGFQLAKDVFRELLFMRSHLMKDVPELLRPLKAESQLLSNFSMAA